MAECVRECGLPEGVFQVAPGYGETGAALVDAVDMVMFTGSTATGKKVMARAAETLTPVSLELGGKDPMVVLADADLERAANAAVYYSMQNGGQTCISIERVYVEEPIYDEFVDRGDREGRARCARARRPARAASTSARSSHPPQLGHRRAATSTTRVDRARACCAGGHARDDGRALLRADRARRRRPHMACMTEETFGPTLPIMKVADEEEAVRLANDSRYGLQALGVDEGRRAAARRSPPASRRARSCVNDAQINYLALELPMGGWKESGLGVAPRRAAASASTRASRRCSSRGFAPRRTSTCSPTRRARRSLLGRVLKLLYGRGKR